MTLVFSTLLVGAAGFYAVLLIGFARGLRVVLEEQTAAPERASWPLVSVVIAARNEEAAIGACLRSVLANNYPPNRFEVLVVDDFSEDATARRVRHLQREHAPIAAGAPDDAAREYPPVRLLRMQDVADRSAGHKQAALAYGLREARGEIICTTDADCTVRPGWLRAMAGAFDARTAFVAGPVRYRPGTGLFTRMQALEFTGLVASGGGAIGAGRPNICNTTNVAYRRAPRDALLPDASALRAAASDELLLQHIAYDTNWRVRFCAAPETYVDTDPAPTLGAFLRQRVRWATMGTRYARASLVASVAALYGFYVLLLTALVAVWFAPALLPALGVALALKLIAEAALLRPACRHAGQASLLRYLVPAQLPQILYVVYAGLAGTLGHVEWKGRRVS